VDIAEARPDVLGPLADEILGQGSRLRPAILEQVGRMRETAESLLRDTLDVTGIFQP
jgi:hypothetical protein